MPDNVGCMFYYGETPWHGKGDSLDQPATADEAIKHGGLDWEVELIPIVTREMPASPITKRMAVVRRDRDPGDPARVLGVVHPGFRPLQNRDGAKIFDALVGRGARIYHTGGYLGNGEVVWLLARLPAEIKIDDNDVVEPYMLFTNSHDGSIAVDFRLTTVRVVCQNTLSIALGGKKRSEVFKRAHQGSYRTLEAEADAFFKFSLESVKELGEAFRAMSRVSFHADSLSDFIGKVVPLPSPPVGGQASETALKQYETKVQNLRIIREGIQNVFKNGFQNGLKIPSAPETLWGALNAVTAFVDHAQEIKGDRYAHILFGRGASLKQTAYKLALNYL
jgi:phage/plasmid-like protein (TIGR03299 family)